MRSPISNPQAGGLTNFDLAVLTAAHELGDRAYGLTIYDAMRKTRRVVSLGHIYLALERLETEYMITTRNGEATPERGGRPKLLVHVEIPGLRALGIDPGVAS